MSHTRNSNSILELTNKCMDDSIVRILSNLLSIGRRHLFEYVLSTLKMAVFVKIRNFKLTFYNCYLKCLTKNERTDAPG